MARERERSLNVLGENTVLSGLPARDYERIAGGLERISLHTRSSLHVPGRPIDFVYFPLSGVISMVVDLQRDGQVEIGTIGNEGMLGLPLLHGTDRSPFPAFTQVPGMALRLGAERFIDEIGRRGALFECVSLYAQAWLAQVAQSTGCNARHSIEQRLSRWLLMSRDRVGADEFSLTQEFIGQMLGVRRASVTVAAGLLHRAGLISCHRGVVTIEDARGLEEASCECYRIVRDEYLRLLCRASRGAPGAARSGGRTRPGRRAARRPRRAG